MHFYQNTLNLGGTALTGTWQPDARGPGVFTGFGVTESLGTGGRLNTLTQFNGLDPNGTWTLHGFAACPAASPCGTGTEWWADYPELGFNMNWAAVSVNMFTMYQTLIAQSTAVLRCTEVITAPGVKEYFLDVDMRIPCNAAGDHKIRTAAYIFAIAYGFGVPGIFYFGYKFFFRRVGNIEIMKLMFMFLTGGYKDQYWYWQAIIMIRKMFLVVVVVFMADTGVLQTYAGMWTMAVALLLQLYVSPNEKHDHNQVEAISLAVIVATLNLGFLYAHFNAVGRVLLTVALLFITVGMLGVFAWFMFEPLRDTVYEVRDALLGGISDISARINATEDPNDNRLRLINDDESDLEMDDVPAASAHAARVKSTVATKALKAADKDDPRFDELEEIDTWTDEQIERYIEQKKRERCAKDDELL